MLNSNQLDLPSLDLQKYVETQHIPLLYFKSSWLFLTCWKNCRCYSHGVGSVFHSLTAFSSCSISAVTEVIIWAMSAEFHFSAPDCKLLFIWFVEAQSFLPFSFFLVNFGFAFDLFQSIDLCKFLSFIYNTKLFLCICLLTCNFSLNFFFLCHVFSQVIAPQTKTGRKLMEKKILR